MNRHRWYKAEWGLSLREIKTELMARAFRPDGFDGFVLEQTREDRISGGYVERLMRTETVTDPFGNDTEFERVEYRKSQFVISDRAGFNLELINPNRSASRLISRFLEVSSYRFVLASARVDAIDWVSRCADLLKRRHKVKSMTAGAISIQEGVIGELLLTGSGDILSAGHAVLSDKSYLIEKVQVQFEGIAGSVVFNSSGAVVGKTRSNKEVIDCARECINLSQPLDVTF